MSCEKNDKYDYLIAMAALDAKDGDVEMFENLDVSDVTLSEKTEKRIGKLIKKSRRYPSASAVKARRVLSKAAVIALIVISVMFTAIMSVSAVREAVWDFIVRFYDEYITVDVRSKIPVSTPTEIREVRKPTLLPSGAEEAAVVSDAVYSADYSVGDELRLAYQQSLLNAGEVYIDSEMTSVSNIMVGEHDGILFTHEGGDGKEVLWTDGEYQYSLAGYGIDSAALILIAESVR